MDSHKFLCSLGNLLLKDDVLWVICCLRIEHGGLGVKRDALFKEL